MATELLTAPVSGLEPFENSLVAGSEPLTSRESSPAGTAPGTHTFWIRDDAPAWLPDVLSEIAKLLELPAGWDSYGSPPISEAIAWSAIRLLGLTAGPAVPRPDVVPTSHGGVALEWSTVDHALEVEIVAPARGHLYHENLKTGQEVEVEFDHPSVLAQYLSFL